MIIAVDFDGTIVDHAYPEIGEDNPMALYWMKRWTELGAKIILWTMRSSGPGEYGDPLQEAVDYLKLNRVELFGINENPQQKEWTESNKAYAQVYVDDAAFGCPMHKPDGFNRHAVDWSVVGPQIETLLLRKAS